MFSKINIISIIKDNFATHRNFSNENFNLGELFLFYLIPIISSIALVYYKIHLKDNIGDILITSFSIFTALLFNLLLLVFDIIRKNTKETNSKEVKRAKIKSELLKQVYSNISYSILVSIICLLLLLILQVVTNSILCEVINYIIYFLALNFIFTLLQILKRIHLLLSNEF